MGIPYILKKVKSIYLHLFGKTDEHRQLVRDLGRDKIETERTSMNSHLIDREKDPDIMRQKTDMKRQRGLRQTENHQIEAKPHVRIHRI